MATGIRVNQLAKELGVESKSILQKLKEEGLGDAAPNHMSLLKLGLAQSVRDWFSSGSSGGTAVQVAPPETATRSKVVRKKKRSDGAADDAGHADESAVAVAERPTIEHSPVTDHAPAVDDSTVSPPTGTQSGDTSSATLPSAESDTATTPTGESSGTVAAPAAEPKSVPVTQVIAPAHLPGGGTAVRPGPVGTTGAPQTTAPTPVQRTSAGPTTHLHTDAPRQPRPTITLANRTGVQQHVPERKPVTVAPKLSELKPATMQGPRVVRIEAPDHVPTPTRRARPGQTGDAPAFTQARPIAGRGVKVTEEDESEEAKKKAKANAKNSLSSRRRGSDGRRGEADEKLREFTEADLIERRDRLAAAASYHQGIDRTMRRVELRGTHQTAKSIVQKGDPVQIEEPVTVKTLAAALGIKANDIITKLMKQGIFASINQALDITVAQTMALDYGIDLEIAVAKTLEDVLLEEFQQREVDAARLVLRPCVVTILGHVDHGKTSLLDKIRNANVAAGEAGGITQHTAAWQVEIEAEGTRKRVTFIDTPGHQAFTSMRARGANMTDVVVLVVSAAEGVQPQTIESMNHAKAAGVPIVVALNKIDRPDANEQKVLGELAAAGLSPIEYGGETEVVRTSAVTGRGIKELIEILDLQAQLLELRTDPSAPARGTVIESRMDAGLGPVATVLIQDGTLRVGDVVIAGNGYGRVRSLWNDRGEQVSDAGASVPVIVSGLGGLPNSGDKFYQVEDIERAAEITEERQSIERQKQLGALNKVTTADTLLATLNQDQVKTINLIIKADVQGSVETLVKTVGGQNTEEVKVRVIHSGVGAISESDVQLAMATKTKPTDNQVAIIGFHVVPDETARALAEQNHIDVKTYRVIYEIFDDMKKALSGMLEPEMREKLHGHAEIRQVFKFSKVGNIAGCIVTDGHIQRGSKIRIVRDGKLIHEDLTIETLKRVKEDAKEVKSGIECGIKLAGYDDIKPGDVLEAYIKEIHQRTL